MEVNHWLLSCLIWLPIIGGFIVLFSKTKSNNTACIIALFFAVITLLLSVYLYLGFDQSYAGMQFIESHRWFSMFSANSQVYYQLGVDGVSVLFILLTCFTTLIIILAAWSSINYKLRQYMAIFLITCGLTNGVFAATDGILFYLFWEALLIPTTLGIGVWGGKKKSYAAIKYFLYTFFGSVFLLACIIFLQYGVSTSTLTYSNPSMFSISNFILWANQTDAVGNLINLSLTAQWLLFGAFFLAFAVKIPMWPLHSWLPDAHSEAPAGGSVILASLMLKLGAYGFLRFVLPLVPNVASLIDWTLIVISLIAVVYVAIVAIAQTDMKRLIAYSSISHMGLVTLAMFSIFMLVDNSNLGTNDAQMAIQGAIFQMISHAFSSGGLFIGCGYLYLRTGSRNISDYQGVANTMPVFATFFMLFAMANIGLPGTTGFVGEFLILLAVFKYSPLVALIAGLTLILAPAYTLWLYKKIFFGNTINKTVSNLQDIKGMETFVFILLAVPTILFGFFPQPILNVSATAASHLVHMAS